jgi:DNA-binding MarR family transcriptional regulator
MRLDSLHYIRNKLRNKLDVMTFVNSEIIRTAYLGKFAQNLILETLNQEKEIYENYGIIFPVRASSTVEMIKRKPGISLSEIARALGFTHQLVAQRIKILSNMSLIEKRSDTDDRRRYGYFLTPAGQKQARLLQSCIEDISQVYSDLYEEIDCDLPAKLAGAISALKSRPMLQRLDEIGMATPTLNTMLKLKGVSNG